MSHGIKSKYFVEAEYSQRTEAGLSACGDVCMIRRAEGGRTLLTLVNGCGSGIEANVMASLISSMIVNYAMLNTPIKQAVYSILNTFGAGETNVSFAVMDIRSDGVVEILEYEMPEFLFFRAGVLYDWGDIKIEKLKIETDKRDHIIKQIRFEAMPEDRIFLFTNGVLHSGIGTHRLPGGWSREGVSTTIGDVIAATSHISARELATSVINRAEANDLFIPKGDMSCMSVYFRQPRRLLLCSGPPFNEINDRKLAERINAWDGRAVLCGGTTASIVARELRRDINVNMRRDISGLPPTSSMMGIDLITEGVLTLARVKSLLEQATSSELMGQGIDFDLTRVLLDHDRIEFVVGTRINPQHQDPRLPVELELRRNVIKEIGRLLSEKFLKEVRIEYL